MVSRMKLMIGEDEKFPGKALALSYTKSAITTIKEKFSEQQLRTFEQSCLLPFIPNTSNANCSLKRKYFGNNKTVSLLELEKAFRDCADPDDVLKLGFVYFAVFVLLGSEKHVHIDMRYLKLAKDLEQFGKYPWGAVSYAKTNASLL
ncbi:unnamed protein product, partial [Prunus brigantina]